jgi:hypothetical protein
MYLEELNRPVFDLDDAHPAKRFLTAFVECRTDCVGREIAPPGDAIDQKWQSDSDGRAWTFSAFAYGYLAFDIELDGFMTAAPRLTESEIWAIEQLPRFHLLMSECAAAATQCGNIDCLQLVKMVLNMLILWGEYLDFRKETISRDPRKH